MNKRRITLNLDEDVVAALQSLEGRSVSAIANDVLRDAVEAAAHRSALLRWLDELDAAYGAPTPAELVAADAILDGAEHGDVDQGTSAA